MLSERGFPMYSARLVGDAQILTLVQPQYKLRLSLRLDSSNATTHKAH